MNKSPLDSASKETKMIFSILAFLIGCSGSSDEQMLAADYLDSCLTAYELV